MSVAVILHDPVAAGAAPDALDTLVQAEAVADALAALGRRAVPMALPLPADAVLPRLAAARPRFVFNLVESIGGEGRLAHLAPLLLESARIPFTGNGSTALLLSSGKVLAKTLMRAHGIPTAAWCGPDALGGRIRDGAWIVKSVWEHASIGIGPDSVVPDLDAAAKIAAARTARLGGEWFAERFVDGREFNAAVLDGPDGPEVLAVAEMGFHDFAPGQPRIVDYAAKWDTGSAAYEGTRPTFARAAADAPLHATLERIALECWRAFGLAGYARVDFRVDAQGRPWVLEVNANPCLSPDAGFALAAAHRGIGYDALVARIVERALASEAARRAA